MLPDFTFDPRPIKSSDLYQKSGFWTKTSVWVEIFLLI